MPHTAQYRFRQSGDLQWRQGGRLARSFSSRQSPDGVVFNVTGPTSCSREKRPSSNVDGSKHRGAGRTVKLGRRDRESGQRGASVSGEPQRHGRSRLGEVAREWVWPALDAAGMGLTRDGG